MVRKIADGADMIVRGYAFTRADDFIRVFNLNDRESSMVITSDGTMVETKGCIDRSRAPQDSVVYQGTLP